MRKLRINLVGIFSPFFRKQKNKYLFASKSGYGIRCNVRILAEYLASQGCEVHLLYEGSLSAESKAAVEEKGIILHRSFSLSFFFQVLTAATVIVGHSMRDAYIEHRSKGRRVINLWHGVPIKAIEMAMPHAKNSRRKLMKKIANVYDSIISSSHVDRLAMASCFGVTPTQVVVSGYPRYDYMSHKTELPEDLKTIETQILDSINDRKLVLYAPTFRQLDAHTAFTPEVIADLKKLSEYCDSNGLVLGVRCHTSDAVSKGDLPEGLLWLNSDIVSETNLLLRHVDCLISDYSGIWVDYLLLDRPLIGYARDYDEYMSRDRGFLYPFKEIFPSTFFDDIDNVISSIDKHVKSNDWTADHGNTKDFFHHFKSLDEPITEKTAQALKLI